LRCGRGDTEEITAILLGVAEFARPIGDFVERDSLCRVIGNSI
jgi:hypothetical protein